MFTSLRWKLIASYAALVFVCLALVSGAVFVLLSQFEQTVGRRDLQLISATVQSRLANLAKLTPAQTPGQVVQEMQPVQGRILLLDRDHIVLFDSVRDDGFEGESLPIKINTRAPSNLRQAPVLSWRAPGGQSFLYAVIQLPPADRPVPAAAFLAVMVPLRDLRAAIRELVRSLLIVAAVVLLLSILLGFFLSRTITRPIEAMTRASEAMAKGNYAQTIPLSGEDEVGRLAASFNTMAHEVDRAHRMERDFVANISHDLKTPLTSIQGFAQALLDGAVRDEGTRQQAARVIYDETERMSRMVNELLELAKLESGQITLARDPVDLASLLDNVVAAYVPRASQSGVNLTADVPRALPTIAGDRQRLEQAFGNLVDNAIKYAGAHASVHLTARTQDSRVEISVSDDGPGIALEDLARIFERFYRTDKSRAASGGTGLGLSIVREIVQAHDGQVTVASQTGRGTTFTVSLPVATESPAQSPARSPVGRLLASGS